MNSATAETYQPYTFLFQATSPSPHLPVVLHFHRALFLGRGMALLAWTCILRKPCGQVGRYSAAVTAGPQTRNEPWTEWDGCASQRAAKDPEHLDDPCWPYGVPQARQGRHHSLL